MTLGVGIEAENHLANCSGFESQQQPAHFQVLGLNTFEWFDRPEQYVIATAKTIRFLIAATSRDSLTTHRVVASRRSSAQM